MRPVFPPDPVPAHPLAQRLCSAIHEIPRAARAECCPGDNQVPFLGDECTRLVSIALADQTITIDEPALDRCEAAMRERVAGCDWVTPLRAVSVDACGDLVRGLKSSGQTCRSALECADGLFCDGLGPTEAGRCRPPLVDGARCGPVTDVLAELGGQPVALSHRHPGCDGYCRARQCVAGVPLGGDCSYRAACGPNARCLGKRCVAGATSAVGEACDQGSRCEPGARCVEGRCEALRENGAHCTEPFECRASCNITPGESSGVCGPRCGAR